jgi:8-oxo-dGTP diphosphatase
MSTQEISATIPACPPFVPWEELRPVDFATLCFVVKNGHVLLIRKKRGLGAGKVNGPGGRLEPGETPLAAAVRETEEELGVTPLCLSHGGELFFQFADGYSLQCTVFTAADYAGEAIETDEAIPLWTPLDAIPYDCMWEDDRYWLPGLLAGNRFIARFCFDGERMLSREIEWNPPSLLSPK